MICQVQGFYDYTYLVDVLHRVDRHSAKRAIELTLRVCETLFTDDPLRFNLERTHNPALIYAVRVQNDLNCPPTAGAAALARLPQLDRVLIEFHRDLGAEADVTPCFH